MKRRLEAASPRGIALLVLALHGLWIAAYFAAGHEARDFVKVSPGNVTRSQKSRAIRLDPAYAYPGIDPRAGAFGNDGQFAYFMALDFRNAHHYMDNGPYRYQRVLYPVAATALSAGQAGAIPYALILINWLSVGAGTFALAVFLRRRGARPAWALVYGLYPGLLLGVQRDLSEPLAYALVAAGLALWGEGTGRRYGAAAVFALAALARQTTVVFPLCFAASLLLEGDGPLLARARHRAGSASLFALVSVGPYVAYTAVVSSWLGSPGSPGFALVPFAGLFQSGSWALARQPPEIAFVALPALLALALACGGLRARGSLAWVARGCVALNVLLYVVFVNYRVYGAYTSLGRNATGIVLAGVMCVPLLRLERPWVRRASAATVALWLVMLPVIAVYGFLTVRI